MDISSLLPSTLNPMEAWAALLHGNSLQSSQGLSDLFILGTIFAGSIFSLGAVGLTLRSRWRTFRYKRRLRSVKNYADARESLGSDRSHPLFRDFNHHLVNVPKQDGSGDMMLRRSVDAAEIFTDDLFAAGLATNRLFQALPGILTGLGVLGTFVGLQIGIGGLDLQDLTKLETSIVPLIQGCAVAFSTSVWGVGVSLLFSFFEKILEGFALGGVRKLQQRIDSLVPRYVPEEAMADLAQSSSQSERILKGLAVEIGGQMQVAVREGIAETLRQEISSAADKVVEAIREAFGQHAEGLGKDSAKVIAEALGQELAKISASVGTLTEAIGSLRQTSEATEKSVNNAVAKLNAHEAVMASMADASEKIQKAADSFASMNETLETSASRNKDAAEAQKTAANVNQEVATKFSTIGERLPDLRQTIEEAAKVIGSIGGPILTLKELLDELPEKQNDLEQKRAETEGERSKQLLTRSQELADTVERAVVAFGGVGAIAEQFEKAASTLTDVTLELADFGQQVRQASQDQRAASEASREAASASKQTTDLLKPLPAAFTDASSGLALAGNSLRQGAESATLTYERLVELQKLWFQGAQTGLTALRDRVQEIIASYGSQIEGQTQSLMNQWTTEVTKCLESYEAQVQELEGSLEALKEALSSIKCRA